MDLYNNSAYQGNTVEDKIKNRLDEINKSTPFSFSNNVLSVTQGANGSIVYKNPSNQPSVYGGNTVEDKIKNRLAELNGGTNNFTVPNTPVIKQGVLATLATLKGKNKEANAKTYAEKIASINIPKNTSTKKENKSLLDNKWAEAVFQAESSGGANRKNEFNDAGKFGWTVGFTKGTYNGIVAKAKAGDQRYIDLLKKIDLDTEEGAKQSAVEYANFKNTLFDNKGNPIGKKYTDPIDIYVNIYNASGNRNTAKNNFLKYYNNINNFTN